MKKIFKLFSLISLLAITGFIMTSCGTTPPPNDKSVATETGGRDDIPREGILSYFGLTAAQFNAIKNAGGYNDFQQWTYQTIPGGRRGGNYIGFPGLNLRWNRISPAALASFKAALQTQLPGGDLTDYITQGVYSYGNPIAKSPGSGMTRTYTANFAYVAGFFQVTFWVTEDYSW
jgi:hypothetical protein